MSASQPSQTLYISNIAYDKARKDGASRCPPRPARPPHLAMNLPDPPACPALLAAVSTEIRRALYALFSTYGRVVDVVHTRAPRMRGTAFVVFRDLASSTAAMRGLDGESFYGRGLRISYAKGTSYATIAQTEGPEAVYAIKLGLRDANEEAGNKSRLTVSGAQKKLIDDRRKEKRGREDEEEEEEEEDEDEEPQAKKSKQAEEEDDAMEESDDEEAPAPTAGQGSEPNPILYIEGLPAEVTSEMLSALFQQYPGLSSIRLLPVPVGAAKNSGTAFVSYDSTTQAGVAKEALDGFLVDRDAPMKVSWAKRG
ncbi:hypothetical protein AAT19DRAFT_14057 [Rhodotorula toruloides]|uniref:RRM domain-containing protein n=1 Tax=Rhodotorula toruloides TaxID=5286 RepID=A0A2T0AAK4_RHOTO|nr:hypothetical protein AAT19DRAFT_14057 [Rhodotorula toruloides]